MVSINSSFKRRTVSTKKKKGRKSVAGEYDNKILVAVILLLLIGVVMVFSASSYYALYVEENGLFFLQKEVQWAVVGIVALFVTMRIDYHKYRRFTGLIAIGALILLVLVLFIGAELNGAQRWIRIGSLSLQPSEIAKYAVVFFFAARLDSFGLKVRKFWSGSFIFLCIAGVFAVLVLAQKNLSITAVIMIVAFVMLFVAGANRKHLITVIPFGVGAGLLAIVSEPYRLERLLSYRDPWKDASGSGFQLLHSLYAIGSGGIFGQGLGNSMQKALYMPEPHNDFIFAIIAEEFGLLGCVAVIGVFILLILSTLSVASRARDNYGRLLATGIITVIAIQALINIGVVTGSMPVTGVPLPFISYGGTALVINLCAMGVVLNISKQCKSRKVEKENN